MSLNSAHTAEYSIEPAIGTRLVLDDNIRLVDRDEETVVGRIVSARARMTYQTPTVLLQATPSIETIDYSRETGLEGENLDLNGRGAVSLSEQTSLSLDFRLSDQATGVEQITLLGSGFEEIRRTTVSLQPSVTHALTDKVNLQLSYSFQEVDFEESNSAVLIGFTYDQLTLTSSYTLDPRNQFTLSVNQSNYDVPDTGFETVNRSVQLGWTHVFSDSLTLSGQAGLIFSETEFDVFTLAGVTRATEKTSGELYNLTLTRNFETSELSAFYSRNVSPGQAGDQVVRDDYSVNWRKRLSEQLSSRIQLTYSSNESQTDLALVNNNFDFFEAGVGFIYQYNQQLRLNLDYRYRTIDREINITRPESNNIQLNLNYEFDRLSWSR